MYFYIYKGQLYWGRHQNIAPHRHVHTWIFRNKPMQIGRLYISKQTYFLALESKGSHSAKKEYEVIITDSELFAPIISRTFQISEGYCYFINRFGDIVKVASTDKNEENRELFKRTFKNRLKEYKGRYFLPIEKRANYP